MKVLIADDHPMVRDALARTVSALGEDVVVVEAADFDGTLTQAEAGMIDIALVDLNMPGMDGLAGIQRLRQRCPTLPLVVISGQAEPGTARAVLAAGAAGFVPKTESAAAVLQALQDVRAGGVFVPAHSLFALRVAGGETGASGRGAVLAQLTPRQTDVLGLLMGGEPNKTIAGRLGLSEGTVKLHIAAILRALQVRNRTEAVVRAKALGFGV